MFSTLMKLFSPRQRSNGRVRTPTRPVTRRARLAIEPLEDRVLLATMFWTNGAGGMDSNWTNPQNWFPNVVPGPQDHAIFNNTSTNPSTVNEVFGGTIANLTVDTTYTGRINLLRDLTVTAGTQLANGEISVQVATKKFIVPTGGTFSWTGGKLGGSGVFWIESNATMTIDGAALKIIDHPTLRNDGVVRWKGAGDIELKNDATIENNTVTSVFDVQNDRTMKGGVGQGTFFNVVVYRPKAPVHYWKPEVFCQSCRDIATSL